MSTDKHDPAAASSFADVIERKAAQKLGAQRRAGSGVWLGLGMMGLVGWSVAVPTLLGAALGMWLDKHAGNTHSWTLALLVAGIVLGCANAGYWVAKEERAIRKDRDV